MSKRISIKDTEPEAYKAMMTLENYAKTIQIEPKLKELIKIRASQLNRCGYCIDMHTEYAIRVGENIRRIFALDAWKESHLFSDEEKAVLQLTEEITHISLDGVTDDTYSRIESYYDAQTIARLIMLIVLINSWNRIAVSTKMIYK